jgi:sodium-dependent phosphate cotransporter
MMSETEVTEVPRDLKKILFNLVYIVFLIALFLLSIDLLGISFLNLGKGAAESFIQVTSNPFISLFIGLLITTIIQSSSTSTSMIVAVVASGSIQFSNAIPMIMGANIGTTITSTLVSLAFITQKNQFRKALAAGTVHDMFNIIMTIILFPLEYYYGFLSKLTSFISGLIMPAFNQQSQNSILEYKIFHSTALTNFINTYIDNSIITLILAFILLFASIKLLSQEIYKLMRGEFREKLQRHFITPASSFFWGLILTGSIQSSSITTSLMVPIVATNRISLKQAFPFIIGANVGTTITALLAALFKSNEAIAIAIVHLIFNLLGALIFLPSEFTRRLPIFLAEELGKLTMNYRIVGLLYIIITFFLIPFLLIYFTTK